MSPISPEEIHKNALRIYSDEATTHNEVCPLEYPITLFKQVQSIWGKLTTKEEQETWIEKVLDSVNKGIEDFQKVNPEANIEAEKEMAKKFKQKVLNFVRTEETRKRVAEMYANEKTAKLLHELANITVTIQAIYKLFETKKVKPKNIKKYILDAEKHIEMAEKQKEQIREYIDGYDESQENGWLKEMKKYFADLKNKYNIK